MCALSVVAELLVFFF